MPFQNDYGCESGVVCPSRLFIFAILGISFNAFNSSNSGAMVGSVAPADRKGLVSSAVASWYSRAFLIF